MPRKPKYTPEESVGIVNKVRSRISAGESIREAAQHEGVKREWYYAAVRKLKKRAKVEQAPKSPKTHPAKELEAVMKEGAEMPQRAWVPLSDWNGLFLQGLATEYGMTVSGVAAFLLSEKIKEYAWRVPEVTKAVQARLAKKSETASE
jgi:transposase-like protein